MHRRRALTALAGAGMGVWAASAKKLDEVVGEIPGTALLVDVRTRRLIAVHRPDLAGRLLAPPGSATKPFTMEALLQAGKIKVEEAFACPHNLEIGGREFNCSHPPIAAPMQVRTALAYSCNCFTAHFAQRLGPGELSGYLTRCGLSSRSGLLGEDEAAGRVSRAEGREAIELQAIGEGCVLVTAAGMAMAYRRLAGSASDAVRNGMLGAVEFGTAQQARVAGLTVAGKTGSVRAPDGTMLAWFCGFTGAVAVAVLLQGRSGGADAAPVAGRILAAHLAGKL